MNMDVIVIWFLLALIIVLILASVKIFFNNLNYNKLVGGDYKILSDNLKIEMDSFQKNKEKVELVDQLHETLFNRLFQITRELLLVQKMMFNKNID